MYSVIKEMFLPPGILWLLLAFGLVLFLVGKRRAGLTITAIGLAAFYILATPVVGGRMNALMQTVPPLSEGEAQRAAAEAIVVLSGGLELRAPEYGGTTVDDTTLARLRYAARLHRLTGLPVLVSGGRPPRAAVTLASMMEKSLREDFGVGDIVLEDRSLDTHENALYSREILAARNLGKVLLVTHASHMPRAVTAFTNAGVSVVPAPTAFTYATAESATSFIPRLSGLAETHYAAYEFLGRLWYAVRY